MGCEITSTTNVHVPDDAALRVKVSPYHLLIQIAFGAWPYTEINLFAVSAAHLDAMVDGIHSALSDYIDSRPAAESAPVQP